MPYGSSGFHAQGGMLKDRLTPTLWSYFPSCGRDGRSIHPYGFARCSTWGDPKTVAASVPPSQELSSQACLAAQGDLPQVPVNTIAMAKYD
ncbi:MAG TPA: hypothetical protein V6D50_05675 [Chroococcales cyanobacterium]